MVRIRFYNTSEEERGLAETWAQRNGIEIAFTDQALTQESLHLAEGFDGICLSQMDPLDPSLYRSLRQLGIRQIAQRSAGVDMYDLEEASRQGILITNVPSYSPASIAEFTVGMALHLIRKGEEIKRQVERQDFTWNPSIRGRVLGEQTVGIVGVGRIGSKAAALFKGFGCRVIGYDFEPKPEYQDFLNYKDSLDDVIKEADIISLHLPLTELTQGLFDQKRFSQCKKGVLFLNMARGGLVDTKALLQALDSGQVAACALDTYEGERHFVRQDFAGKELTDPLFEQLLQHPRVVYSPHVAFYTDRAVTEIVEQALDATLDIIQTGTSSHLVYPN